MKKPPFIFAAGLAALVAGHSFAQSGGDRVIARVGDEKITLAQLQSELPPGTTNPAVQKTALQQLIARKLLVQEAVREQLDKTPVGAMVVKRAQENAIAGVLEKQLAGAQPVISDAQIQAFVAANPMMFANRRLLTLNQFVTESSTPTVLKKLQAANDMDTFQSILIQNSIVFRRASAVADTLKLDPRVAVQLAKMKTGDVFISPRGAGLELSDIVNMNAAPVVGAQADEIARAVLTRRVVQTRVSAEVGKILKEGEPDVKINDAYAPKKK
jgi:peptidyl-prolyl cis-trans isomerase C